MTNKRHAQTPLTSEPPQHLTGMTLRNRALGQSDIAMGGGVDEESLIPVSKADLDEDVVVEVVVEVAVDVQMILEKKYLSLINLNK